MNIFKNTAVEIVTQPERFSYALQLLRNYFFGFQLEIINIEKNMKPKLKTNLVIWLTDKIEYLSQELIDNEKSTILADGAFILRTTQFNNCLHLMIIGGGVAGVIYAVNELVSRYFNRRDDSIQIPDINVYQSPALPYRLFWTWDHSTNWYLEQNGMQDIGFANPYSKPEDGFLQDYMRLIDFMSMNRINGVTIYGFLRDSHGGIDTAKELCRYANERGVRILPGVGINCYGGIYWEGNHRYNLSQWLNKNPRLRAQFEKLTVFELPEFAKLFIPDTHYLDAACPSKPENIDYHVEAIQWLAETFELGGINFETGDYGVCKCADCSARRTTNEKWAIKDMALLYPRLFSAAKKSRNDLWLVCEAYWDNILDLDTVAPLADLPDDAIYQFCVNRGYWGKVRSQITKDYVSKLPRSKNILRTHMGTQWQEERYKLVAQRFADLMQTAYKTGMKGATIFSEASAFNTVNEINYLAFARFGYDSTLTWEKFVTNDVAPILGGYDAANRYLDLLAFDNESRLLKSAIAEARDIATSFSGEVYRRWIWLQNYLHQKLAMV